MAIFFPGGTPASVNLTTGLCFLRAGLNIVGFKFASAGGALKRSINGSPVVQAHAGPTVIGLDGTCDHMIGRVSPAVSTYAAVTEGMLWWAHVGVAVSDEELQAWTDQANALERWVVPASLSGHANLVSLTEARNWSGSGSLTSTGSAPVTFAVTGAVPKVTLPTEKRLLVRQEFLHNNFDYTEVGSGLDAYAIITDKAELKVVTDATSMVVEGYNAHSTWSPKWHRFGAYDGTTKQSVRSEIALKHEVLQLGALAAGSKTVSVWGGVLSKPTTTILGDWPQAVRVPSSASLDVTMPSTPSHLLIVGPADSIASGDTATDGATDPWAVLLGRGAKTYPGSVLVDAYGYRKLADDCSTDGARQALAEKYAAAFAGVTTPRLYVPIGTNDYKLAGGLSAANFAAYGADWLDRLKALVPSLEVWWQTILLRNTAGAGDEIAPNSYGDLPSDYRAAVSTIATGRAWVHVVDGTALLAYNVTNFTDIHPTTVGHGLLGGTILTALGY